MPCQIFILDFKMVNCSGSANTLQVIIVLHNVSKHRSNKDHLATKVNIYHAKTESFASHGHGDTKKTKKGMRDQDGRLDSIVGDKSSLSAPERPRPLHHALSPFPFRLPLSLSLSLFSPPLSLSISSPSLALPFPTVFLSPFPFRLPLSLILSPPPSNTRSPFLFPLPITLSLPSLSLALPFNQPNEKKRKEKNTEVAARRRMEGSKDVI